MQDLKTGGQNINSITGNSFELFLKYGFGSHGNTVAATVLLIVGEMAGGGILALPAALASAGVVGGMFMLIGAGFLSAFTGIVLSECYQHVTTVMTVKEIEPIVSESHSVQEIQEILETKGKTEDFRKYPYCFIGKSAFGAIGEYAVMFCQVVTLNGVMIVFMIISGQNMLAVTEYKTDKFWISMTALLVTPITWLESPKDFWQTALIATLATVAACVAIFISSFHDKMDHGTPSVDFNGVFTSFGTIMFAFGGHALFPTIQLDMQDPSKFTQAVGYAYTLIQAMYIPLSLAAYYNFGDLIDTESPNILSNLSTGAFQKVVTGFITAHLVMAIILVQNPVSQLIDKFTKIPKGINPKRIIVRTLQVGVAYLVAYNVELKYMGTILNLVGGTTTTCLTFIFPSLFAIKLFAVRNKDTDSEPLLDIIDGESKKMGTGMIIVHILTLTIGAFAGVASTYSAIKAATEL